ncbi:MULTISPECIES: hypothetical protein [unclassified Duganella]|jgi:hypothetical protein|uniref:hypothetical protein n=1 Tax=unclassified Duganella TaxID=2636909 RepID=UPI00088B4E47|nr:MULTISPECIES: hypothetical protein [unclassified Duganella]SDG52478.1 hypothetical protein SAMN05216320_10582 [Duganella sp. OV458]SDJ75277.1 hypothetical protein SAMN05428973_10683 [Duganella sp. OV510]
MRLFILCVLAALLGGCANLQAVREFGQISSLSAGYTRLSDDYVRSPLINKSYTLEAETQQRATLDAEYQQRLPQAARLQVYHKVVSTYMATLAELAGDDIPTGAEEVDGLVDAAAKANYLDAASVAPARAIGKLLTDATLNGYRHRELKKVIAEGNAPIQALLASLVQSMQAFDASLKIERASANRYYRSLHARARENNREPVAAEQAWASLNAANALFDERERAIPLYIESLRRIAIAHQALYDGRDDIDNHQLLADLKRYTKQIRSAYNAVRAL